MLCRMPRREILGVTVRVRGLQDAEERDPAIGLRVSVAILVRSIGFCEAWSLLGYIRLRVPWVRIRARVIRDTLGFECLGSQVTWPIK